MAKLRFDWRLIALIVTVAVLANGSLLPWPVLAAVLAISGGYLIYQGWQVWGRASGLSSGTRVSYWRGQRYELPSERRSIRLPSWRSIGPALLYLVVGGALALGALAVVLRQFGG